MILPMSVRQKRTSFMSACRPICLRLEQLALDIVDLSLKDLDLLVDRCLIVQSLSRIRSLSLKLGLLRSHSIHLSLDLTQSTLNAVVFGGQTMLFVLETLPIILKLLQICLEDGQVAVLSLDQILKAC